MFVRASLTLPVPAATAGERLLPLLHLQGLDRLSGDSYEAGALILSVGPLGAARGLSKTVRVETLEPRRTARGLRIPFRWSATGRTGQLFPALDADLDVTAVDDGHCLLTINAAYTPPFGAAGAQLDRLLLHRAAHATMCALLRGLAEQLLPGHAPALQAAASTAEISFFPELPGAERRG